MQELEIKNALVVPAQITWNKEELAEAILIIKSRYENVVFNDDQIADAKKDRAKLNAAKKVVNEFATKTKKELSATADLFAEEIKSILQPLNEVEENIGNQIKNFEEKQREEKRELCQSIINAEIEKAQISFFIGVQDSWLNKSTTKKKITEEVQALVAAETERQKQAQLIERMKKERLEVIEEEVRARNENYNLNVPLSRFMSEEFTNIDTPQGEILSNIYNLFCEIQEEEQKKQEAQKAIEEEKPTPPTSQNENNDHLDALSYSPFNPETGEVYETPPPPPPVSFMPPPIQEPVNNTFTSPPAWAQAAPKFLTKTIKFTYEEAHREAMNNFFSEFTKLGVKFEILD